MTKIVGSAYKGLKSLIESYAKADRPVLLLGNTGSGKELFAQYFMELSKSKKKRKGAQRTVSCATFSDSLLHGEIFGHVIGAFTGADAGRDGLLRTCNEGILFLDELDKASTEFQHAVLRVAEGNSFRQIGSDKEITNNDTLIIAAASRLSLISDQLVNRFHILAVPPLQKFDIPELAEHFLGRPLKDEVSGLLVSREYPGNVRELQKFCEKLKIERGTNLFSSSRRPHEDHSFDYERFRDEFLLWHEYITPIIDQFQLDIRYECHTSSGECESYRLEETIKLMKVLRYGSKDIRDVEAFDLALRSHIKKLELPNLLGEIYTKCKAPIPQDIRGRISGELPKLIMKAHVYQGDHAGELPTGEEDHELPSQLQELCRLPIREARKKFSKLYLDTVLRKTDNDLKRTAEMTRLTKKGLESIMKRYDIKIYPTK